MLLFLYEPIYYNYDNDTFLTHNISIIIAAVYLYNLAKSLNNSYNFGIGDVEQTLYIKAYCNLFRNYGKDIYILYPNSGNVDQVPILYYSYYG